MLPGSPFANLRARLSGARRPYAFRRPRGGWRRILAFAGIGFAVLLMAFGLAYARAHNAHTYLVPDPPQVELYESRRGRVARDPSTVVLGWVGNYDTAFNLYAIWEPLERLFERYDYITLRLLGVGHDRRVLPRFEKVRYSILPYYTQAELIDEVLKMDIGLFPLFDVEDESAVPKA